MNFKALSAMHSSLGKVRHSCSVGRTDPLIGNNSKSQKSSDQLLSYRELLLSHPVQHILVASDNTGKDC